MAKNVLVVDDDLMSREMMETVLKRAGYIPALAATGDSALSMIQANPPDLVLLDARIGEPDGFEVCAMLKAEPTTAQIPIILLTSLNRPQDIQRATDVGADGFYYKNDGWPGLMGYIKTVIG